MKLLIIAITSLLILTNTYVMKSDCMDAAIENGEQFINNIRESLNNENPITFKFLESIIVFRLALCKDITSLTEAQRGYYDSYDDFLSMEKDRFDEKSKKLNLQIMRLIKQRDTLRELLKSIKPQ